MFLLLFIFHITYIFEFNEERLHYFYNKTLFKASQRQRERVWRVDSKSRKSFKFFKIHSLWFLKRRKYMHIHGNFAVVFSFHSCFMGQSSWIHNDVIKLVSVTLTVWWERGQRQTLKYFNTSKVHYITRIYSISNENQNPCIDRAQDGARRFGVEFTWTFCDAYGSSITIPQLR